MFAARWRWNAARALAILRFQRRSQSAAATPAHACRRPARIGLSRPGGVSRESHRTDSHSRPRVGPRNDRQLSARSDGHRRASRRAARGGSRDACVPSRSIRPEPSAFCHEILNANPYAYLDDAPLEERRARAVQLRRTLRDDVDGAGVLDPAAIAEVAAESWPVVRDADELHDALATLIVLPPVPAVERVVRRARRRPARDDGPCHTERCRGVDVRGARAPGARRLRAMPERRAKKPQRRSCAAGSNAAGR